MKRMHAVGDTKPENLLLSKLGIRVIGKPILDTCFTNRNDKAMYRSIKAAQSRPPKACVFVFAVQHFLKF